MNTLRIVTAVCGLAAACCWPVACADTDPTTVTVVERLGMSDGTADAVPDTPCMRCVHSTMEAGTGCLELVQACLVDEGCTQVYWCVIAGRCLEEPTSIEVTNCGLPCAQDAGIIVAGGLSLQLAYEVFSCSTDNCGASCRGG